MMPARSHAAALRAILLPGLLALGVAGCASDPGASSAGLGAGRVVQQCKSGDTVVASEAQCLQDDAACYALADGQFCTGERGASCPSGSAALPAGAACPPGSRCFTLSESLSCTITVN